MLTSSCGLRESVAKDPDEGVFVAHGQWPEHNAIDQAEDSRWLRRYREQEQQKIAIVVPGSFRARRAAIRKSSNIKGKYSEKSKTSVTALNEYSRERRLSPLRMYGILRENKRTGLRILLTWWRGFHRCCCVRVNRKGADRVASGHPWIFASDVISHGLADPGDVVRVVDPKGRSIGVAHFSSASQIALRLLSARVEPIDEAFLRRRLEAAYRHRQKVVENSDAYRLVHAEGDLLPGLIVDRYGDWLAYSYSIREWTG